MNSIYITAAAATQNYVSGANNQTEAQSQWRRNHSQQRGHPTESSPAQPRPRGKSPHPQIRGISRSIRAIINDRQFKPARKNDSVEEIANKLQLTICISFKNLVKFISKSSILVGGQAVIEGVMMRVPGFYATAVRNPKGEIEVQRKNFILYCFAWIFH